MKFKFAFQKLFDHKKSLEDMARRDYFEAQAKVDAANRKLTAMYEQIDQARLRAGDLSKQGGAQGSGLVQIDDFIKGQNVRIDRQRAKISELMVEAEHLQERLVEAAKERKTIEKIRERRLEDFKLRQKKIDLKILDELVVTRFKHTDGE